MLRLSFDMTQEIPDWIASMTVAARSEFVCETDRLLTAAESRGDIGTQQVLKHQLKLVWTAQGV